MELQQFDIHFQSRSNLANTLFLSQIMRFQSTLGAIALLLARANARITGFSMPETIKIGEEFALKMDGVPSPDTEWPLHVVFWFDYKLVDHDYLKFHTLATYQIGNGTYIETRPV